MRLSPLSALLVFLAAHPALAGYGRVPLAFERNSGQVSSPDVAFVTRGAGFDMFLTRNAAVLSLATADQRQVVRIRTLDSQTPASISGKEPLPSASNYLIGNDPRQWRTGVPHFARVEYDEIYAGIDLAYYGNGDALEYDFIVAPGADPNAIALSFEGVTSVRVDERGDLVLTMPGGELRQHKPVVYQNVDGVRRRVEGGYRISGDRVGFIVGEYDRSQTLIIDPTLAYSTYLGGTPGNTEAWAVAVDGSGHAYVAGVTGATSYPTTAGAFKTSKDATLEAFITKLSPSGNSLVYSTFLGGSNSDTPRGIAVDAAGNAYVAGITNSTNFPLVNPVQSAHGGGLNVNDAFVAKLNAAGSALEFSTYLGGSAGDHALAIALDASGNPHVTGVTASTNFPTLNAFQPAKASTNVNDAFITGFTTDGALLFSTYFGSSNGGEEGNGIAVDPAGNIIIAGTTSSGGSAPPIGFPIVNGWQPIKNSINHAFVTKFTPNATAIIYSTGISEGNHGSHARAVAVDSEGNAYITGDTDPLLFPVVNPISGACATTSGVAFVTKLAPLGGQALYSTCLGGVTGGRDEGYGIAVDRLGSAYVTGFANKPDFPTVAPLPNGRGLGTDAFLSKLSPDGGALMFSTFLGGNGEDRARAIAVDPSGKAYVAGITSSTNFPTVNPFQATKATTVLYHAFVSHLDLSGGDFTPPQITPNISGTLGLNGWYTSDVSLTWTVTDAESPIATQSGCEAVTIASDTTGLTFTCTATSEGGTNTASVTIKRDATKPVINVSMSPMPNAYGWHKTDVTVDFSAVDLIAGIDTSPTSTSSYTAEGLHSASFTITDAAGNLATLAVPVRIDKTAPTGTYVTSSPDGSNGWYRTNVTILYTGEDALSGVPPGFGGSTILTEEGPNAAIVLGTIEDRAGNVGTVSLPAGVIKIDKTGPVFTVARSVEPNAFGWNNTDVTVTIDTTDAVSGIAISSAVTATVSTEGTNIFPLFATDVAGNKTTYDLVVRIDKTAPDPDVTVVSGVSGLNGWYTTVVGLKYTATDAVSGLVTPVEGTYTLSDQGLNAEIVFATATDHAGNSAVVKLPAGIVKIDSVPPVVTVTRSVPPNEHGWNNTDVTVTLEVSDATSGTVGGNVTAAVTAEGIHNLPVIIPDNAGNVASLEIVVRIDKTPPSVAYTIPPATVSGWYTADVPIAYMVSDSGSGLPGLGMFDVISGAYTITEEGVAVQWTAPPVTDRAGNTVTPGAGTGPFKIDKTAPVTTATPSAQPNAAGWYNTAVSVTFEAVDLISGIDTSPVSTVSLLVDGVHAPSFMAKDIAGNTSTTTYAVKIDRTAPVVTCAGADGLWHSDDVTIPCTASDALSGVAGATSFTLSTSVLPGAETANALTGTMNVIDVAGNVKVAGPVSGNRVDKKAPVVTLVAPAPGVYVIHSVLPAQYTCTDGGSGVASCIGSVPAGALVNTATVGAATFTVNAADGAGHTAFAGAAYSISYGVKLLYDAAKEHNAGSSALFRIQLVNAAGANLSAESIKVTALKIEKATYKPGLVSDAPTTEADEFKFDPDIDGGAYIFKAKLADDMKADSYALVFKVGTDPVEHLAKFQVK